MIRNRNQVARCLTRAVMETLDTRRLLSVTLGSDGTLSIEGTPGNDVVMVSRSGSDAGVLGVSLNRQVSSFPLASVRSVVVRLGDGNDRLVVLERGGSLTVDCKVFAGSGNDRIQLGLGNDLVDAGPGNDLVIGGAGDDLLFGGEGNDRLVGGVGDDHLVGGDGNDRLDGGDGDDLMTGDAGNDVLFGGAGDDALYGDDGNDLLDGGGGDDLLLGGDQNDRLLGKDGDDDLFGEGGRDSCDGGNGDDFVVGGDDADQCRGGRGSDTFSGDDDSRELKDKDRGGSVDDICVTADNLPEPVRRALDERFPGAELIKIDAEDDAGDGVVTHFEIVLRSQGRLFDLDVLVDGTIRGLEAEDCPPVSFEQLPEAVRSHFSSNFPGAVLVRLDAEDDEGDGVITAYELKFTFGGSFYEVTYAVDGRVLELVIEGDEQDDEGVVDDDDGDDD